MIRSILGHACIGYRPSRPVSLPPAPWVIVTSDRILDVSRFDVIDLGRDDWSEIVPPAHVCDQIGGGK